MKENRWLIVHADDFGLSAEVNQAIMVSCQRGIVRAVAMIANGREIEPACRFARQNPQLAVGLHLNVTQGKPVLAARYCPSLVDNQGWFYPKKRFIAQLLTGRIAYEHLRAEAMAQAEKIIGQGLQLCHINSHHHVHALPLVAECVRECAEYFGIGYVRQISLPRLLTWRIGGFRAFSQQLIVALMMRRSAASLKRLVSAQQFWGFELTTAKNKLQALVQLLRQLPPGINELMCHPAVRPEANDANPLTDETTALCDPGLQRVMAEEKIILSSTAITTT